MRRRPAVQQAFDEARFGATRILNVREPMVSGEEAVRRADGWLRAKQVERAGEVLVITGRGNGSVEQVPVVREAVRRLLTRLRRGGVVAEITEHTPGSFAVRLAPLRALFDAPARNRDVRDARHRTEGPSVDQSLTGLEAETRELLRRLALQELDALGLHVPDEGFVHAEMARKFSVLTRAIGGVPDERRLREALLRALAEYEDGDS